MTATSFVSLPLDPSSWATVSEAALATRLAADQLSAVVPLTAPAWRPRPQLSEAAELAAESLLFLVLAAGVIGLSFTFAHALVTGWL